MTLITRAFTEQEIDVDSLKWVCAGREQVSEGEERKSSCLGDRFGYKLEIGRMKVLFFQYPTQTIPRTSTQCLSFVFVPASLSQAERTDSPGSATFCESYRERLFGIKRERVIRNRKKRKSYYGFEVYSQNLGMYREEGGLGRRDVFSERGLSTMRDLFLYKGALSGFPGLENEDSVLLGKILDKSHTMFKKRN